jgi:hypothetical protein
MVSVSTLAHNKAIASDARRDLIEISSGFMPYKCDVIAMGLVYYSRDIGVKSLALYFIE